MVTSRVRLPKFGTGGRPALFSLLHVVHLAELRSRSGEPSSDQLEDDDRLRLVHFEEHRGVHVDAR